MARCWRCKKAGLFVQVGKSGLCVSCLEDAQEASLNILTELKRGGFHRKRALDALDEMVAEEMVKEAKSLLVGSPFSCWPLEVHATKKQLERVRRSVDVKIKSYDPAKMEAVVVGSESLYRTTPQSCTCKDFQIERKPCKHMYCVAARYWGVDFNKCLTTLGY